MSGAWFAKTWSKAFDETRSHSLRTALEVGCWVVGGAMLILYSSVRFMGEVEREQGIEAFTEALTQARSPAVDPSRSPVISTRPNFVTPGPFAWHDFQPTSVLAESEPVSVSQDQLGFPKDSRLVYAESKPALVESLPIALLSIARVGLEVPVFADTSERNLNRGAGWVKGTAAPDDGGNMAIAAHRDGYFRVLKDVELGDVLILESFAQETSYRVTEISIVEPGDTSSLRETESAMVTLVTCYPFYFVGHAPQRFIVRAEPL